MKNNVMLYVTSIQDGSIRRRVMPIGKLADLAGLRLDNAERDTSILNRTNITEIRIAEPYDDFDYSMFGYCGYWASKRIYHSAIGFIDNAYNDFFKRNLSPLEKFVAKYPEFA